MKSSIKAAVCGICSALSVVLMFLGGVIYIFSYTVPMILGLLMIMLQRTFGRSSALTVYFASSVLSFLLVPEKETVLLYILFFGYYPMLLPFLEKIKPKILRIFVKFLVFNVSILVVELLCVYAFGIPFFEDGVFSYTMIILFAVLMNIVFIAYEFALKSILALYVKKLEGRIKKIFKM